jgi:transcriptional regulator with XRE-family HTH domain
MNLNSKKSLIARLRKGKAARAQFIESNLAKSLAYNLRATRDRLEWSQERLASEVGTNQNAISRLESADYGKQTMTTLKRLAKAMDVALIVRFVPFSELIDWVSGTRRIDLGLATESLAVPSFEAEEKAGLFDIDERVAPQKEREHRLHIPAMPANNPSSQEPMSPVEYVQHRPGAATSVVDIGSARDALICGPRQADLLGRLAAGA